MSFLSTSTTVRTTTLLPSQITMEQVLSLLHDSTAMLDLNPIIKSYTPLGPAASDAFSSRVSSAHKPPTTGSLPVRVYKVVESSNPANNPKVAAQQNGTEAGGGASWRGSWSARFIPDEICYETSNQGLSDGMITITHAPFGVSSVTKWTAREATPEERKEGGGEESLMLEKSGTVTSNRMLMSFIKTTIQASYEKLAKDFVEVLKKRVAAEKESSEAKQEMRAEESTDGQQQSKVQV